MSRVQVQDAGGAILWQIQHEGNTYPNFPHLRSITNIHELPIRDDDTFICGYPKSGTHWIWEVTRLLTAGRLLEDPVEKGSCMLEYVPQDDITSLPSPRILNTHFKLRLLPPDIVKRKCKIIYLLRNPKDVSVSYYNYMRGLPHYKYEGCWGDYMKYFFMGKFSYGSWFDYVLEWEQTKQSLQESQILTVYYEDLQEDSVREIRRINDFLETDRDEDFLKQVSQHSSFGSMKCRKQRKETYRKGQVGDWKNWFTVAQNEWFDQLYQEKMKDCPLNIRFTID